MPDPITEVPVLVSDLVSTRDMLSTSCHKSIAEDMIADYKRLNQRVTHSALTLALQKQIAKLDEYIELAREDDE